MPAVTEKMADLSISSSSSKGGVADNLSTLKSAGKKDTDKKVKALSEIVSKAKALQGSEHDKVSEVALVNAIPQLLDLVGDKSPAIAKTSASAVVEIAAAANPFAVKTIIPLLGDVLTSTAPKWNVKLVALHAINALVASAPSQLGVRMPDLVPILSQTMWDTKPEIKIAAKESMTKACTLIANADIDKFIPELINTIESPEKVSETVHLLGATTFVQEVQSPTLSIMVPLLNRGLQERATAIKRKSAVIIDNMCKLVDDPDVVAPFLPKLMPLLIDIEQTIADPECRDVVKRAIETLTRVGNVKDGKIPEPANGGDPKTVLKGINEVLKSHETGPEQKAVLEYVAGMAGQLIDEKNAESVEWTSVTVPYFESFLPLPDAQAAGEALRKRLVSSIGGNVEEESEDEEGEDLCNCDFSLAYGAKILLNRTNLHLKRGRRYGLCGPNGSGKSTLMRAIANGQVEGFPPPTELKTVYVEHDIDSSEADTSVVDFIANDERIVNQNRKDVEKALSDVGFTDEMLKSSIGSLSGGWKMKLALARAMLQNADILLLDEPTNHLDVKNVAWLENFLTSQTQVTSMIVSHDSGFLDHVVQFIIHYERFKLKKYKGNLSDFIKKVPSAKSYQDLGASEMEFDFPEPGFLENVKTKQKAILRSTNMEFQYTGTPKPQLTNITFQCSLGSRIAVIGPNGAGKSTLIKVLTGELIPTKGEVYQHENCRIAYVAQHAFHHIDKPEHLDKTPSEYIQYRFQTGEDREIMDRANRVITDADEEAMNKIYKIEGSQRRVLGILSRRKLKNSYEYECSFSLGQNIGMKNESWTPMLSADNAWLPRSELMESHTKLVAEVDMKEALASGQFRPLTRKEIESHCAMFGLDAELVTHSRIKGLSGGQKVKLVLAAGSWLRPHLIVLDEPTNYLDRDSLGALSKALHKFGGGVIIITHSAEFTKGLTEEVWSVLDGKLTPSGHNWVQGQGTGARLTEKDDEEDQFDAYGNKIEKKQKKKKLTSSEARKKKKDRMARRKKGEEVFSDSDD